MRRFAGLDVPLEETSVCIVDEEGKIVRGELDRNGRITRTGDAGARAALFERRT